MNILLILHVLLDVFFCICLVWCWRSDYKKREIPNKAILLILICSAVRLILFFVNGQPIIMYWATLLMFIPIGIVIDVSEKVNRMLENKVPLVEIAQYYLDFTIYFANILFPIFLFLSVIWFTSKLANNTEIIAILSSGISFTRFCRN